MKYLIFEDTTAKANLNFDIKHGTGLVNSVLEQYNCTTLKPISDKATLQAFFADPVLFVSNQVQASANLGAWKINPSKMVDLLQEPEITELLKMAKAAGGQPLHYVMNYCKLTKKGVEVDQPVWGVYVDKQCNHYTETPAQVKSYEATMRLIAALTDLHNIGGNLEHLVNLPLGEQLLKFNGSSNPVTINLHGFGKLAG